MASIVHAVVILSGVILIGAGTIAEALRGGEGQACQAIGTIIFIIGLIGSGYIRFLWGAIAHWRKGPEESKKEGEAR
ncbi:MAG TPA: hypothetical protein VNE39_12620 [Planctomycetota bacterium]|nr:hypothetical protein [Planctomycetota bacterium]